MMRLLLLLLLCFSASVRAAPEEVAIALASGTEIQSQRHAAAGPVLALWLTGQHGRVEEEHKAAADLAARGVETWVTDFFAPYFLPLLPSSYARIPDADLAAWLQGVHERNPGRRIVLLASGRGASLAFRAAEAWRQRHGQSQLLKGAVLLFPLLYQELQPGEEPEYDPAAAVALDLVILQPTSSAGFWWKERLKDFLERAGSHVRMQLLPGLRDGFYRRGDINAREIAAAGRLGDILLDGLQPFLEGTSP